jgi:hypothetical protein
MRILTQSGRGFRFDVGRRSAAIPATIPKCARPPEPVTALGICFPRFSNCGAPDPSMIDEEIGMPTKRELSVRQLRHLLLASSRSGERA